MVRHCLCTQMYIAHTKKIMFSNSVHGILQEEREVTGFCPSRMKGYHIESRHGIGPPSQALWLYCTKGSRGVLDVRGPPCPAACAQLWCIATAAVQLQAWPPSSFSLASISFFSLPFLLHPLTNTSHPSTGTYYALHFPKLFGLTFSGKI